TNEREGSEIAHQVVRALLEARVKVLYVTHLFELARRFYDEHDEAALFLRAGRESDGRRTFRLEEGAPLPTSHGRDLYQAVFTEHDSASTAGAAEPECPISVAERGGP